MGKYLNCNNQDFLKIYKSSNIIDKTNLIKVTNSNLNTAYDKYMCVTRPEGFGKTSIISMLNAYYSKGADSKDIFKNLKISKDEKYLQNLNKYNVIKIDVSDFCLRYKDNFIYGLKNELLEELKEEYGDILDNHDETIADILIRVSDITNERFIFLIDNWDIIMLKEAKSKLVDEYILFLTAIFRGTDIHCSIDLVYLTGIIPIKLYSMLLTRLDIFNIYSMIGIYYLKENCDFSKDDVKELCNKNNISFEKIEKWYGGYYLNDTQVFNVFSVLKAINEKDFKVYKEIDKTIVDLISHNNKFKDIIKRLLNNENIEICTHFFENDLSKIKDEDSLLTALIHFGLLGYNRKEKTCYIPNYESKYKLLNILDKI